jgi:hypothetical protein
MKTIVLALIAAGLCAQAQCRTLSTVDGTVYNNITRQRIDPDGVYIEYTLPGGGIGMSKVKYARLSRALQKQFGYDAADAREYEAAVAQANEDCSQDLIQRAQIEREARQQRDRENEAAYPGRMAAIRQLNAAIAARPLYPEGNRASDVPASNGISYGTQFTAGNISSQTSYSPATPDLFPNRGITSRGH